MPPEHVSGFDHVSLPMQDADAMVAFYRSLGFDVAERPHVVSVYVGAQMINFHRDSTWLRRGFTLRAPKAVPPCGDLCFVWDGTAPALQAMLERVGAEVEEGPVAREGGRRAPASSVYIRDPDGNLLEFMIYDTDETEADGSEIVIRGGTVFDGTGAPGRIADVAIADGIVQEIGANLHGARELDAAGCAVAPGFIDIHTHYDAQVFWDPALRPSSYHGVTTVVAGNCGFSIAPTRPADRAVIVGTLQNVEDMDPATLTAGIVWEFETHPEYLDVVRARGTMLNFTAYIGHSALRIYVMGDAAYERAATGDEIARMCALVRDAIERGAAGFSTSFSFAHRGVDGKPVPSRFAERDEVDALFRAVGETGKGVILITPGKQCTYEDVYEWQPRIGRPFTYPLFAAPGGKHLEPVRLHEQGRAHGARVWPQVTPRPLTMQFTMEDAYSLNTGTVFGELMKVSRAVRLAAYRDPVWRALAATDLESSPMKPRWDTFEVSESKQFPELQGRRVGELARERGAGPLDVMCDLALAEDLETRFRAYIANDDVDAVAKLLTHEHVALGLSDAGAHVDQLCDAPLPTDLLGTWVRARNVMPLEHAVRKLTGEPADMFGFARRGYLREGSWADVCVFDPQTVGTGPTRRVRDFPADAERLTAEEPTGVRHVLVNGTPIRVDEHQLAGLETRPGVRPDMIAGRRISCQ